MSEIHENEGHGNVGVHIDQNPYQSPTPTSGAALYALARIHEGHGLFREVDGNQEDEPIARDGHAIVLKQDEHFHSAKDRHFKIIVNLVPMTVEKKVLSFDEVVKLAYPNVQDGPNVVYTVTFKKAANPHEGTLDKGQSVEIKNGTIFNVRRTDRS